MNRFEDLIGSIVKGLEKDELSIITKLQPLGSSFSVEYSNLKTRNNSSKVLSTSQLESIDVIGREGEFNFKGDPEKFKLFAEAERINSAYQFDPLYAVNCSIVDPLPHQVEAVYKFMLPQPRIRFLLADDTGAGKTIMTGLLLKELMMRELIRRILIITPGGLTKQWQEDEMAIKFNFDFKIVNRAVLNAEPNVFNSSDTVITSIDFISREDVINAASGSTWDLIVFDEAHKLSAYDYGNRIYKSKRYDAAHKLSKQSEHLLLLTATPHRGRKDTFKKLLQLLDEDVFVNDEIVKERIRSNEENGVNRYFIRRLKESMKDWNGNELFKKRFTQTSAYELTPEEKRLYDEVTAYLTEKKKEAKEKNNIHVSLALSVMQRRLTSSIFALKNTLFRRYKALSGIIEELNKNPGLWRQRQRLEEYEVEDIDDFDELDDNEREGLENILSDPRKFKLFTTAKDINEIREETDQVRKLYEMAESLLQRNQEEKKFQVLGELLNSQKVIDGEKLVIFTEHRDTLIYLEERLRNSGYGIATIHGAKNVEERRDAQFQFAAKDVQILIATDAAGEGINLQFCRLLINWDIPWNPNRLEQRMGRIHRYGQKNDVIVFNLVASNTREGQVLEKLLEKIDIIRETIGDDRVYDVIQDVLEDVSLESIIESVLDSKESAFTTIIDGETEELEGKFRDKIREQKEATSTTEVDYSDAKNLKDSSDEKRLQPVYIRNFFENSFASIGGEYREQRDSIFEITKIPDELNEILKSRYKLFVDLTKMKFCFDKQVFWDYQHIKDLGHVHYINPGNKLFDSIVNLVREKFLADMMIGTILISPEDSESYFAYFVRSQIKNVRIADEKLLLVESKDSKTFVSTSPSKFIDLHQPNKLAIIINPPDPHRNNEIKNWVFANVTEPQFKVAESRITFDADMRKHYLESAFSESIGQLQEELNELQPLLFQNNPSIQEKINDLDTRIEELIERKKRRLLEIEELKSLHMTPPEVIGCAFVVPLSQVEYQNSFGMSRDDDAEIIAMNKAMEFERSEGWTPTDVSKENEGYDIRSVSPEQIKRYIEVKGRNMEGGVMISENEMNRLSQLGDAAWLYIVTNCKTNPELFRIQNPAANLKFQEKSKGVQYFVSLEEWRQKTA